MPDYQKPRHFKDYKSFKKWKQYININKVKTNGTPNETIFVHGKRTTIKRAEQKVGLRK